MRLASPASAESTGISHCGYGVTCERGHTGVTDAHSVHVVSAHAVLHDHGPHEHGNGDEHRGCPDCGCCLCSGSGAYAAVTPLIPPLLVATDTAAVFNVDEAARHLRLRFSLLRPPRILA